MKILQLGKFYPIEGGVDKVMLDLTMGLSERGVICDMLCAANGAAQVVKFNVRGGVAVGDGRVVPRRSRLCHTPRRSVF